MANSWKGVEVSTDNDEKTVCLQSNRYVQAAILTAMHADEKFRDISLFGVPPIGTEANSLRPIRAHKNVLAYASKHLHELLTSDEYTDSNQAEYRFENVDHDSLRLIIEFIYTGKLTTNEHDAIDMTRGVLIGAKYLVMNELADACEAYLAYHVEIKMENCVSLWCFSRKYTCLRLMHATTTFMAENINELPKNEQFLKLSFDDCAKLLLSEAFVAVHDDDDRFNAAFGWIVYSTDRWDLHLHEILNMVPITDTSILCRAWSETCVSIVDKNHDPKAVVVNLEELKETVMKRVDDILETRKKIKRCKKSGPDWYVIGGVGSAETFWSYDIGRQLWSDLPPLPVTRAYCGACAMNNNLIIMGGLKDGNKYSADIDEYNLATKTWSNRDVKLREARCGLGVCSDGQYAYVVGGRNDKHIYRKWVEQYDPKSNEIIQLADMGVPRYCPATIFSARRNSIFVAGGWDGAELLSSIDKYDPITQKWSQVGNMENARWGLAAAESDDDLYLLGGVDDGTAGSYLYNLVEIFNTRTCQIRTAPRMIQSRMGCSATTISNGKVICVLGGETSESIWVEYYDVREGKWWAGGTVFGFSDLPKKVMHFGFAAI